MTSSSAKLVCVWGVKSFYVFSSCHVACGVTGVWFPGPHGEWGPRACFFFFFFFFFFF